MTNACEQRATHSQQRIADANTKDQPKPAAVLYFALLGVFLSESWTFSTDKGLTFLCCPTLIKYTEVCFGISPWPPICACFPAAFSTEYFCSYLVLLKMKLLFYLLVLSLCTFSSSCFFSVFLFCLCSFVYFSRGC